MISNSLFWHGLETVIGDLEPICYATNINQKDSTRADQVLLTIIGMFLHFADHPEPEVSKGMAKKLEERWKDCDQPVYLLALILNPFEMLSCCGPDADMDAFKLCELLVETFRRIRINHPKNTDSQEVLDEKEHRVAKSFMNYLAGVAQFELFRKNKVHFKNIFVSLHAVLHY